MCIKETYSKKQTQKQLKYLMKFFIKVSSCVVDEKHARYQLI